MKYNNDLEINIILIELNYILLFIYKLKYCIMFYYLNYN